MAWPGEQLVRAAQDGDAEAVRALVSGSYPHVLRFAKTLCATPQDAEDAAQEALIILYSRIGMLRATAALGSWMFRIVRNECLRRARGGWRVGQWAASRSANRWRTTCWPDWRPRRWSGRSWRCRRTCAGC